MTAGSGMPLWLRGNYMAAARVSEGVLGRDNANHAIYISLGRIPGITGYHADDKTPRTYSAAGTDFAYLWNQFELRGDFRVWQRAGIGAYAALGRLGVNLLEENRLKLEFQTVFKEADTVRDYFLASGISYAATAEFSMRTMYEYENIGADNRLIFQLYYYLKL
jgi:hypothetical protein